MKKVFLITDDPSLRQGVELCAEAHTIDVHTTTQWADARDILFKEHFDAVFIDYEVMKLESLDAFILLDNVLQKEGSVASLILRKPSERARQFIESLASFGPPIELRGRAPSVAMLQPPFNACLREAATRAPQQALDKSAVGPILVEVHLHTDLKGTFGEVSLARALYTLAFTGASGTLFLKNDKLDHQYAIYNGSLRAPHKPGYSNSATLASSFAWERGSYRFESNSIPKGKTEEPYAFIYDSMARHMPARRVMQTMMPQMRTYPVHTDQWASRTERLGDLALLARLMRACDGQTTLERALGSLGADATRGFQAALYATETDLLWLQTEPTSQSVSIQYNREVTRFRQQQVEVQSKDSKAYRAKGSGRASMEAELSELLQRLEHATPYEIFDVWEGCGKDVVRTKFYEMVKQHHPDVYGGNISGDVKRLVQEIFITIKDTYDELMKTEREQRCPRPAAKAKQPEQSHDMGAQPSFGAVSASSSPSASSPSASSPSASSPSASPPRAAQPQTPPDSVRQSRIERLKMKRSATPISLGREPSAPIGTAGPRARTQSTADRRAKLDRIRSNSSSGKSSTGAHRAADAAAHAFNEGYTAWRENDNIVIAAERFATAYNREPGNGKYMTFYGYFLFLKDAENLEDALRIVEKALELKDRQSLPDAHVFMGHLLKVKEEHQRALRHYEIALRLNPTSRDALREIRLYEKRNNTPPKSEVATFWKSLFKK